MGMALERGKGGELDPKGGGEGGIGTKHVEEWRVEGLFHIRKLAHRSLDLVQF